MAFLEEKSKLFKNFVKSKEEIYLKGNCLYIEGVFKLLLIDSLEIDVKRKREIVKISGNNLEIVAFGVGFVAIEGEILHIEVVK